jgi:hypothetical protein
MAEVTNGILSCHAAVRKNTDAHLVNCIHFPSTGIGLEYEANNGINGRASVMSRIFVLTGEAD